MQRSVARWIRRSSRRRRLTARPRLTRRPRTGPIFAGNAGDLPDGTHVDLEGWIVVDGGVALLIDEIIDVVPPTYDIGLRLHGVDLDTVDTFVYPDGDLRWGDRYRVSGTIRDGGLVVDAIDLRSLHPDRHPPSPR